MNSPRWLAPFLFAPGLIYEGLVRARNGIYSAGILPEKRLPRPVISIGNLTLGGAGKSPLVIEVARSLLELGAIPAILSRGYGRDMAGKVHIWAPGSDLGHASRLVGDEPAVIKRHVPGIWLGISADRYAVGQKILEACSKPVFILDDGFQHRRLYRDLDIVVIDRTQLLARNRVFPRGTLREPLSGLRRAHIIIVNGIYDGDERDPVETLVRTVHPAAKIFHCVQRIDSLIPFSQWKNFHESADAAPEFSSALLVAAVGNPDRFRADIQALPIRVKGCRFFGDHRRLTPQDWMNCTKQARRAGADVMITTEKDAIKLTHPPDFPLLVSVQSTQITHPVAFRNLLKALVEEAG